MHFLVVHSDIRLGVESGYGNWAPFRVHLGDTFLDIKSNIDFLILRKLYDWDFERLICEFRSVLYGFYWPEVTT